MTWSRCAPTYPTLCHVEGGVCQRGDLLWARCAYTYLLDEHDPKHRSRVCRTPCQTHQDAWPKRALLYSFIYGVG
jgi:hypothetical protein